MYIKSSVELIYVSQGVASNGSPLTLEEKKIVMCDEMETFSNQYYTNMQRDMRTSRNLVVPTYLTNDLIKNTKSYQLMFCNYDGKRYKVKNILKMRNTRQQMILDIQEVRS